MTSLQLSQINAVTDGGFSVHQNQKGTSKLSVNGSSLFLKNFKESMNEKQKTTKPDVSSLLEKSHKRNNSRSRSKSSVFRRLYHQASLKQKKIKK